MRNFQNVIDMQAEEGRRNYNPSTLPQAVCHDEWRRWLEGRFERPAPEARRDGFNQAGREIEDR